MMVYKNTPFQDGLKDLIEMKFGKLFKVFQVDAKGLNKIGVSKIPGLIIIDDYLDDEIEDYVWELKRKGSKVVLFSLTPCNIQGVTLNVFDGFLLKSMPTYDMLKVLEEIMNYDETYVHPAIGRMFLSQLIAK